VPDPVVRAVPVPGAALALRGLSRVDFADAFAVELPALGPAGVRGFAEAMLAPPPPWVASLMAARDRVAGALRLRTATAMRAGDDGIAGAAGRRIGAFRVLALTGEEVLLGANDRHLDFRISVRATPTGQGMAVSVVTAVKINNLLGRLYLVPVLPMHRLIVPALMRQAARAA
jgi:hypothetical protein